MVGHTHENVHQMFSRVSVHIVRKSVPTLPILQDLAREAYHPMPNVQHLENIWDYRQMGISSKVQLVGYSSPHQFKFVKEGHKVLMHFKEWPLKSTTYQGVDVTSLAAAYGNEPQPIQQIAKKCRKVFEAMEGDLKKWQDGGKMTEEQIKWWKDHLQRERELPFPSVKRASQFQPYRCPEEAPEVAVAAMQALHDHIRNLKKNSTVIHIRLQLPLYFYKLII